MTWKYSLISATLKGMHGLGLPRLAPSSLRGHGVVLTFHHVRPWVARALAPNRELEIEPACLEAVIRLLRRKGFVIVSLDEALERCAAGPEREPFAVLTFDDGYRDNRDHALPILRRERAPATFFLTTGFIDATAGLWWMIVEEALKGTQDELTLAIDGLVLRYPCVSLAQKNRAGLKIMQRLRQTPQATLDRALSDLIARYRIDDKAVTRALCLSQSELDAIAGEPLLTIGAHTVTHPMLRRCDEAQARREIVEAREALQQRFVRPIRHLAYPVGDCGSAGPREYALARAAGYRSAVTTRPGFVTQGCDLHALPRLSINGYVQDSAAIDALLSGIPTYLWSFGGRAA
jgi:peptidoglycan/xylan/chitin deacetylase (PgdA/CDA1 family)